MAAPTAKRACLPCKTLKIKCSRTQPKCSQCENSERTCAYPDHKPIRFRDETDKSATVAIQKWRARSTKEGSRSPPPRPSNNIITHPTLSSELDLLARGRFLYDFAHGLNSVFAEEIRYPIEHWASGSMPKNAGSSIHLALDAVAFANFSRRHNDPEAGAIARQKHGLAAIKLMEDLKAPSKKQNPQAALTAVLMGMYQNIYPEPHMAGFWVHHYCGAVNILLEQCPQELPRVVRLLTRQALIVSFRINTLIRVPPAILSWMKAASDAHTSVMQLGWQTAELILSPESEEERDALHLDPESLTDAMAMDERLNSLEHGLLMHEAPVWSVWKEADDYPEWFRPFSRHPGFPRKSMVFMTVDAAGLWRLYQISRLNLLVRLIAPDAVGVPVEKVLSCLDKAVEIVEDVCASIFYVLQNNDLGRPSPTSFREIPGSPVYAQSVALNNVLWCIKKSPMLNAKVDPARRACVAQFGKIFSGELGISEALFWKDGDEAHKKLLLDQLSFKKQLGLTGASARSAVV